MINKKRVRVIILWIAVICILALIVRYAVYVVFGTGMYSDNIVTNVAYADSKRTIPMKLSFEYEVRGEEKITLPIQISEEHQLTVEYDIQFEEVGDLIFVITDSSNEERFSLHLTEGRQQKEISLPKGKYNLEVWMKESSGSGEIKFKGLEYEKGS